MDRQENSFPSDQSQGQGRDPMRFQALGMSQCIFRFLGVLGVSWCFLVRLVDCDFFNEG